MSLEWLNDPVGQLDRAAMAAARTHQGQLTKPPGALGRLEDIAIRLAGLRGTPRPVVSDVHINVFAGDHGVAAQGVSAFPQSVTAEMVKNFASGGAAISVLARLLNARLQVINLGTVGDTGECHGVINLNIGKSTADFTSEAAMSDHQLHEALNAGRRSVDQADLFIGGEMGIGNTTSATSIACALLAIPPASLVGPGTGLDADGMARKTGVIQQALDLHNPAPTEHLKILRCLGGFEIAALTGAYLACGQQGVPVLVDGFISTVAALLAVRISPDLAAWLFYSHCSAEPGHQQILGALDARPLLDLGMRLGEGSGAAVAVPLLQQSCALHNQMATFAEAAVSGKNA